MSRVLIADDQRDVLEALRILLKGEGHQTEAVTSKRRRANHCPRLVIGMRCISPIHLA